MKKILPFKKQILLLVLLTLTAGLFSGCVGEKKAEEEGTVIDTTYREKKFEKIKETDNTPPEIDNSTLEELDALVEEVSSDTSFDDELSDLTE